MRRPRTCGGGEQLTRRPGARRPGRRRLVLRWPRDGRRVHAGGTRRPRAVLHESRRPGLRPRQPAGGRQGRALRALLALAEIAAPALPRRVPDRAFDAYDAWLLRMRAFCEAKYPRDPAEAESVYRMTIRAKALDTRRGMLPAATTSNVGIYGTGQAYEQLLLRMRAHPLGEVRAYADLMLVELRKVIPAFLKRVDLPDRGGAWSAYLAETRRATEAVAAHLLGAVGVEPREG